MCTACHKQERERRGEKWAPRWFRATPDAKVRLPCHSDARSRGMYASCEHALVGCSDICHMVAHVLLCLQVFDLEFTAEECPLWEFTGEAFARPPAPKASESASLTCLCGKGLATAHIMRH